MTKQYLQAQTDLNKTFLPTSKDSGLIHAKGVGHLLQRRGPLFYSTGVAHKLFVGFRPILVSKQSHRRNAAHSNYW